MFTPQNKRRASMYFTPPSAPRKSVRFRDVPSGAPYHNVSLGSSVMKMPSRKAFRGNSFKAKVLALEVAQHAVINDIATALTHDTIVSITPTLFPTQGVANVNRIGDEIFLEALKIVGTWQTAAASNGFMYRIIVGFSGNDTNTTTSLSSGLGVTDLFLPGTGSTITLNGIINPKAFTCLYDETITCNSQTPATADYSRVNVVIPIKQGFAFRGTSGGGLGKFKQLYVAVMAAVVGGTIGTTSCGATNLSMDLIFKNSK